MLEGVIHMVKQYEWTLILEKVNQGALVMMTPAEERV